MIVGYTTGVFDLFHLGHLNLLRNARNRCDMLIVGVTTDELCQEVKKKTPIIPFEERVQIVSGCKYVDIVTPQTNMNKMSAWEDLHFNIMFVGSDWKGTEKWNMLEEEFNKIEVPIIYLEYTKGISSTEIRERLRNG